MYFVNKIVFFYQMLITLHLSLELSGVLSGCNVTRSCDCEHNSFTHARDDWPKRCPKMVALFNQDCAHLLELRRI